MALTNWASQRQEMFSGSSQGVPSGCRAGLGLDYASLVVSSSSGGEAGLALGALEMRGWEGSGAVVTRNQRKLGE